MSAAIIRTAFEALGARDVEPLVALMHPEMEFVGKARPCDRLTTVGLP